MGGVINICLGKEILLKSVIQVVPSYVMSVFLLPISLCEEIERMMNSFWWGRKKDGSHSIQWQSWDKLCYKKVYEDLGFHKIRHFNVAVIPLLRINH